jgi:hypothetical protein
MKGTWYLFAASPTNYPGPIPPHRTPLAWHSCPTYSPRSSTPPSGQYFCIAQRLLVHLVVPVVNVVEALAVSDVVDDDDAAGAAVVGVGDGSEALLAGSVPLGLAKSTSTSFTRSPSQSTMRIF